MRSDFLEVETLLLANCLDEVILLAANVFYVFSFHHQCSQIVPASHPDHAASWLQFLTLLGFLAILVVIVIVILGW